MRSEEKSAVTPWLPVRVTRRMGVAMVVVGSKEASGLGSYWWLSAQAQTPSPPFLLLYDKGRVKGEG